jgi:hypothetical protein
MNIALQDDITGENGVVEITTWLELEDVNLTQSVVPQSP